MGKGLKWILIIGGGLTLFVVAALIIIPFFVDINKYKPEIEKRVAEATGRPFTIGSDLDLSLFPFAGIKFSNLQLGSPQGFKEKEFVTIKEFEVRVKLLPLISRELQVKRFIMNQPRIVLVKNKTGKTNWGFGKKPTDKAKPGPKSTPSEPAAGGIPIKKLDVREFAITEGTLVYIDHAAGLKKEISDFTLKLDDVSLDSPIKMKFSATFDKKPISLEGAIGPVGKDPARGTIPMDLSLKALKELEATLKGQIVNPAGKLSFDIKIDVKGFSPRKLVQALGQDFPVATKDPKALDKVALSLGAKGGLTSISISDGTLVLDDSKLTFSAKAKEYAKPDVAFEINLDAIDLDRYLPPKSEEKEKSETSAAVSKKEKTDYAPLRRMVLNGSINIGKLKVNNLKTDNIVVKITGKNGIFNLKPAALKLYQGEVNLSSVLNVQTDVPNATINLETKKVQAGPLLKDMMNKDIIEGTASATVALRFKGDTPDAIKKTLNGKGQLRFEDGAVIGVDIPSMVRNVQSAFGYGEKVEQRPKTDFTELSVPFTITNGLFNTPGSSMQSPLLRLLAAGKAHLVKETLDFRIEPKLIASIKGQGDAEQRKGLLVPVLVTGTFSSPKFSPDLRAIAEQQLKKQVLESDEAKKVMNKEEFKQVEDKAKGMLKGLLGQ